MVFPISISKLMNWMLVLSLFAALTLSTQAQVAAPDLTKGEKPINSKGKEVDPLDKDINLGPTGMKGWVYHKSVDSSMSRQILVTQVDEGSPAHGTVQINDIILGANGKGEVPLAFTSDPRVVFGNAIGDAEARNPALLKLLIWRGGKTVVAGVQIKHLGFYSDTAPYNCAKSARILEQGLQVVMEKQNQGSFSMNALTLMAANYPDNPSNGARQAKAREWARLLILSQEEIDKRLEHGYVSTQSKVGWTRGHRLLVLAEYYLLTRDPDVFPSVEAMAVEVCNGFSHLGTMGHQFSNPVLNGKFNGPYNIGYGAINSAGVTAYFGLLLARQCGVERAELNPAIARATNFYGSFVSLGAIPYGEHGPGRSSHESNGKMGLAALAFSLEGSRPEAAKYFSKMAAASASEREVGHCGAYFNYIWSPLGANAGGDEAAASHFSRISWRLDLSRTWDGGFDYDCWYHYTTGGPRYANRDFWATIPPLLTYAMPLRQLVITGKHQYASVRLSGEEVAQADFADTYDATTRSTLQLIAELGHWSPKVQSLAAKELAERKNESEAIVPQLIAIAGNDSAGEQQVGACFALAEIKDGRAADVLAGFLTHPDEELRWAATYAMRYMPRESQLPHLETMLKAAASTIRPFQPLADRVPLQFAHAQLSYLLFYNGNAYGPRGVIAGDQLKGVDRELLYPAIIAAAQTPMGHSRGSLSATFSVLTEEDVKALSATILDTALVPAPADNMFKSGVRTTALATLQKHHIAEGVVAAKILANDPNLRGRDKAFDQLAAYAKSSTQVMSALGIIEFCEMINRSNPNLAEKAKEVLDAIAAGKNSVELLPLKRIKSVMAKDSRLKLPATSTELMVEGENLAKAETLYTWRKIHGVGEVTFSPNASAAAKQTSVQFDGKPGKYLFEVTMSDSQALTEMSGAVGVILQDKNGKLPANRPPTAEADTIKVPLSTTTPVMLLGADPERHAFSYSVRQKPAHGVLRGEAPALHYTPRYGYSGPDRFTYQVTDSEGQTASATIAIQVASDETLQVAIYEPFDYPAGLLNGQSSSNEVGLYRAWKARDKIAKVSSGSLSYAGLPTRGGKYQTDGGNNWGGVRPISPSALKANGLLDDGATLWFSAVVAYGPKSNYKWDWLTFALANNGFHEGNSTTWIMDEDGQPGTGVGFMLANHGASIGGRVVATQYQDVSKKKSENDAKPNIYGSWGREPTMIPKGGMGLVVGRFIWGEDSTQPDRIEIYGPSSDLELPEQAVSTLSVTVDQSTFDTLTFDKGGDVLLDEIRFGPTYESVLAGTKPLTAE